MRLALQRFATLLAVVLVGAAVAACSVGFNPFSSATATPIKPSSTATPVLIARVIRVTKSRHFADSRSGGTSAPCANGDPLIKGDCGVTVTATCAAGDVVVSGGYTFDDPYAFVTSSYPSSASAWTITAHDEWVYGGNNPVTVTAYADCLHANFDVGETVVSATPDVPRNGAIHSSAAFCPEGSVVTGGGFRGTFVAPESIPEPGGWSVALAVTQGSDARPQLFVLCAAHHFTAATGASKTASPGLGQSTDLTVPCPGGTMLVGGGAWTIVSGDMTTLAPDGTMTAWHALINTATYVSGGSTYTSSAYAVCVTVG